ncbi:hypothetical protein LQ567_08125 [Niabella pedocola]|uniref:Uncharacterized protein n=1 Tax=Niabella pedocola TaxID=1752077 RepID=A0ABS8PNQ2_9BACT|nr:hypothetical protein [Niabella pedocola]MCD2422724.1 hypothetical protein [Niabella pedocola]
MFTRKDDHQPSTRINLYAWERRGPTANDEGVSVTGNRMQCSAVAPGIFRIMQQLIMPFSVQPATESGCIDIDFRSPGIIPVSQMTTKIDITVPPAEGVPYLIIPYYLEN